MFVTVKKTNLSEKGRNEVDLGRLGRVVNIIKIHRTKLENLKDFKKKKREDWRVSRWIDGWVDDR